MSRSKHWHRTHAQRVVAESVRILPAPGAHRVAIRGAIAMLIVLGPLAAIDRLDLGLAATFGIFASVYGGRRPCAGRARVQLTMGAVFAVCVLIGSVAALSPARAWVAVPVVGAVAFVASLASSKYGWRPPGPMFMVFAAGATAGIPSDIAHIGLSVGVVVLSSLVAVALGGLESLWWPSDAAPPPVTPATHPLVDAASVGSAVTVAGGLATLLGSTHPYWAMMAAAVLVAAPTMHARLARGIQRAAGTFVGLALAALVLVLPMPVWLIVAVAALVQALIELVIGRNYAFGLLFVTPLALLLGHLASHQPLPELLADRLLETVLGVAIGAVAAVVIRPRPPRIGH